MLKSLYYYGSVNIDQPINSNNIEKFMGLEPKRDSSGALMQDSNGKYIFNQIELEKIIVTPKNKSGGKE